MFGMMVNRLPTTAALLLLGAASVASFSTGATLPQRPGRAPRNERIVGTAGAIVGLDAARSSAATDGSDDGADDGDGGKAAAPPAVVADDGRRTFVRYAALGAASVAGPRAAVAAAPKGRTEGYEVRRTEREWAYVLSGPQYNILRRGGTERQRSSILNTYASDDAGAYVCAACPTALFASADKFPSGTGWPSFSRALEGVEKEAMNPISAALGGREVRCGTCGGHLGDLFQDGFVYPGTSAFQTGERYCIDGAALVFKPADGGEDVYGDTPPPNKVINYEPAVFRDKSVNSSRL